MVIISGCLLITSLLLAVHPIPKFYFLWFWKKKKKKRKMEEEDLQFAYRDGEFIAFTQTHTLVLKEPHFDFDDYHRATQTRVLSPPFQQLVQNALKDHFKTRLKKIPQEELARYLNIHDVDILAIITNFADFEMYSVDGFQLSLMPHQLVALDFALSRDESLLALDLGLGKTPTSFAYLRALKITRALIVCPASLKANWLEEVPKFLKHGINMLEITNGKKAEALLTTSNVDMFLVSYELFPKIIAHLAKYTWGALICDEAHALKNSKSVRAKSVFALRKKIKRLVFLTGTPSPTNVNMWNLLRFMNSEIFANFFHYKNAMHKTPVSSQVFHFAERYSPGSVVYAAGARPKWAFKHSIRCEELHALSRQYVLRQKKQDVLDLPPLLRERVVIGSATKAQKKDLETTLLKASLIAKEKGDVFAQALLGEQVRETAKMKLPFVLKYLSTMLDIENQEKFIVWAHSKCVITTIQEHLTALKVKHIVINGDTNTLLRPGLQKQFEHDNDTRVAILSLTACGTGGNWAFVSLALYAELTFLYVPQSQSEGRCHRIGQKGKSVVLQYLILKDSTDDMLWKSFLRKVNNESLVLDNKKSDFLFEMLSDLQEPDDMFHDLTPKTLQKIPKPPKAPKNLFKTKPLTKVKELQTFKKRKLVEPTCKIPKNFNVDSSNETNAWMQEIEALIQQSKDRPVTCFEM